MIWVVHPGSATQVNPAKQFLRAAELSVGPCCKILDRVGNSVEEWSETGPK
jgi:hypothetical protein